MKIRFAILFSSPVVLPPFFLLFLCFLPPVFGVWESISLYILAEILEFLYFVGVGLALRPPPPYGGGLFLTLGLPQQAIKVGETPQGTATQCA